MSAIPGAGVCSAFPHVLRRGSECRRTRRLPVFKRNTEVFLSCGVIHFLVAASLLAASLPALATVFAAVHGVVHDPQHRPIAGAKVTLQAADSAFVLHAATNSDGEFALPRRRSACID